MNRKEDFWRVLKETLEGRAAQIEFEVDNRRYLRRFVPEERLILLGGGHIAVPLCEIAAILGFLVTVVDDRPSFVNRERFPRSAEVICDSFENAIERLKITSADYVCVITRGHKWDGECLRQILKGACPSYLGMLGSRRRVKGLLEMLKEEGYGEEKLSKIHAPIGLKINAQTPAEIALSICAEIVQQKRNFVPQENNVLKRTDTDMELLWFLAKGNVPAAYMIVVSTKGSTPVETGAIMAVDKVGRTKGTIGGGCGESEVLTTARGLIGTGGSRLIHVDMTNEVAMEEGMACGGMMNVLIEDMAVVDSKNPHNTY